MNNLRIFTKLKEKSLILNGRLSKEVIFDKMNASIPTRLKKRIVFFDSPYSKEILPDRYVKCVKFISRKHTDYLLYSADSEKHKPKKVAVGTLLNGNIYLISEKCPHHQESVYLSTIKNGELFEREDGEKPKIDKRIINAVLSHPEDVTFDDIECVNVSLKAKKRIARVLRKIKRK